MLDIKFVRKNPDVVKSRTLRTNFRMRNYL